MRQKEEIQKKLDELNLYFEFLENRSEKKELIRTSIAIKEYFKEQKEILERELENEN